MNIKAIVLSLLLVVSLSACENKSAESDVLNQVPESAATGQASANTGAADILRQIPKDNGSIKE